MPVLRTERLTMRPFVEADLDEYAAMMAEPEVVRFFSHGPLSRPDAWRSMASFLGHEQLRGWTNHAVVDKASGRLLGRCGLWRPEGWPGTEVGWMLARSAWGHGYATEAAAAWRDWAFAHLELDQLVSIIHRDNTASIRVAQRIGHRYLHDLEMAGMPCQLWGQEPCGSDVPANRWESGEVDTTQCP